LVSIHNDQEQTLVNNAFGGGWIGLNDVANEGAFVWSDGSPVDYTRWRSGEPNNVGEGGEDWGQFEGGQWNDLGGSSQLPGIAKYSGAVGTVNPVNGHTYFVLPPMEWGAAEAQARLMGGHLASISNAAENTFVHSLWPGFKWIGFTDEKHEGQFRWTDGSPTTFDAWFTGEPNDEFGEDYTAIFDATNQPGAWNDADTSRGYYSVVEVGPVVGDLDGDDRVGLSDFGLFKNGFGDTRRCPGCDLTGDNIAGLDDFGVLKDNFGATKFPAGGHTVPEPTGVALMGFGAAMLSLAFRPRRNCRTRR